MLYYEGTELLLKIYTMHNKIYSIFCG